MRYIVAICLCVCSVTIKAQDISGTWEDYNDHRFTYYTRLCIANICGKYIGYTYDKDKDSGYCKTNFYGTYNKRRQYFWGESIDFIMNTRGHMQTRYSLFYKKEGDDEILEGTVSQKPDSLYQMIDGIPRLILIEDPQPEYIRLVKTSNKIDSTAYVRIMASKPCKVNPRVSTPPAVVVTPPEEKIIEKPVDQKIIEKPVVDTPVAASPEDVILQMQTNRKNDTLSVVSVTEKELMIRVIDNALTDGDTISILQNRKLIAHKIPVARIPFLIKLELSKENPQHELILVAHNLGSIPPNTALLLISSGDKEYRLAAFADLKKNAVIVFRYVGE
ncbi:MAG: hypothetical protein HOP10_09340 [Chitinophagaceae bacterium]|nr:hypothetical protein [Chitinophagaceae bacterium]